MIRYGRKENKNERIKKENCLKIIVIGYAYLSHGKHITSEPSGAWKTRRQRSKIKHRRTEMEESTKQDQRKKDLNERNGIWNR